MVIHAEAACYPRSMPGKLFVVATPLGNLEDLSARALSTLRSVAAVLCEDTRQTAKLLARFDLRAPTLSCHEHNEARRTAELIERLESGDDLALVSDAGTPGISDPGSLLVRAALDAGIEVRPVPGPSAVATLLSVSGVAAARYVFEGFLPHRGGERRRRLRELAGETRPLVLFESPQRVVDSLRDIETVFGPRRIVVGRELTKIHETILHGSAAELADRLEGARGEFTLIVEGADPRRAAADADSEAGELAARWERALSEASGDRRAALKRLAKQTGLRRAELYRRLVEIDAETD